MHPPGDARTPGLGNPGASPNSSLNANQDWRDDTSGVSQPAGVLQRCADGRPCCEVVDRLVAADTVEYIEGDVAAGRQLRETAARWADAHQHGSPQRLEAAG